jgi:cullin 1
MEFLPFFGFFFLPSQDPKAYVETILKVYNKFCQLVNGPFRGDAGFLASLDRACREIVNKNKVTEKSPSRTSELLAKFCDAVLKKSAKNPEKGELEEILSDVVSSKCPLRIFFRSPSMRFNSAGIFVSLFSQMIIFKYVDDKDVFQKFYQKMLARRLVQQLSASDDAEESMISKLKEACGYEYTQKLQRMFTDMGTSRDLNNQFKDHMKNSENGVGGMSSFGPSLSFRKGSLLTLLLGKI